MILLVGKVDHRKGFFVLGENLVYYKKICYNTRYSNLQSLVELGVYLCYINFFWWDLRNKEFNFLNFNEREINE